MRCTHESLQVVIRVRPPLARELQGYRPFENAAMVDPNQRVITLSENLQSLTANGGAAVSPDNGMVRAKASVVTSCINIALLGHLVQILWHSTWLSRIRLWTADDYP